jgi:hypothetical protein
VNTIYLDLNGKIYCIMSYLGPSGEMLNFSNGGVKKGPANRPAKTSLQIFSCTISGFPIAERKFLQSELHSNFSQ